jgi:hypothetical protein
MAILLGRAVRYGAEGILAVRYGDHALDFLKAHGAAVALTVLAVTLILFAVSHFALHKPAPKL